MRTVNRLILGGLMVALVAAGGCATARAKSQADPPALEVPMPPPRVIVPPEPEPEAPPAQAPEPEPRQQKPPRRPAQQQQQQQQPRPDSRPPGADKKPDAPPATVETVKPPVSSGTLEQALPAGPEVERHVRDQIAQATGDLKRVDYGALNADAKAQYDTAKRFVDQAEQALKEKNLVFAAKVAEKAAGLAAILVGR
jgi:hypothetical protein